MENSTFFVSGDKNEAFTGYEMTFFENSIYRGISSLMDLLGRMPEAAGRNLGKILGAVWFAVDKKHRRLCLDNLARAYAGEKSRREIKALARRVFTNTATMVFDHARFHRAGPERFSEIVKIHGLDNLKRAHAKGKGVICFSGHLGNWELASAIPVLTGYPFSVVYKTIEYPPFEKYVTDKRSSTGCIMLPLHNALENIRQSLDRGELAGLIIDQNSRKRNQSVFVDFMGRKASANTGPARLALSTKAPVIPVFIFQRNGQFVIDILSEVSLVQTGDYQRDIEENTREYHAIIERYVRKYPDQWFWIHNRWRTRPLTE